VDDHLTAISARLSALKIIGVDVLDAAIHTFRQLWPGVETQKTVAELVDYLKDSEDRLNEWRESAGRAGADEAMKFVLSWYENLNLEAFKSIRSNGLYVRDPEYIQKRKEVAYGIAEYADVHVFHEDPNAAVDDDEEDEDDVEEAAE